MNRTLLIIVLGIISTIIISAILIKSNKEDPTENKGDEMYEANMSASADMDNTSVFEGVEYERLIVSYEHTKPGEYSDIYFTASGFEPGTKTIVYLKKTGSDDYEPNGHEVFADQNGNIESSFRITQYGSYDVEVFGGGPEPLVSTVVVK